MRRFFSITTVLATLFCIANIFFPLGSLALVFSVFTLVFAFILFRISKTPFKKKLPKVLIAINLVVALIFIVKPLIFKDKVEIDLAIEEQREEQEKEALDELELLEAQGILDGIEEEIEAPVEEEKQNKTFRPDSIAIDKTKIVKEKQLEQKNKEEENEIEFEQPVFQ